MEYSSIEAKKYSFLKWINYWGARHNRKQFHTIIDDLLITLDFCVAAFCDTTDGEPEAEKVRVFELEL